MEKRVIIASFAKIIPVQTITTAKLDNNQDRELGKKTSIDK